MTLRHSFKLLLDDPEAVLVIYFHGAAGTLASGYRPASYRAISAGASDKIHVIAIDYRGFGKSTGTPSEDGRLTDALTLVDWAVDVAHVPPSRIVLFGQSLGTAVGLAVAARKAQEKPPTRFSGMVLVAPFVDVETLTATYRVAGTIPILSPLARLPKLLAFFNTFIVSKWSSKTRLAELVKSYDGGTADDLGYHITIIHAEDDYDIPWSHSETLSWHAVNASTSAGISWADLEKQKRATMRGLGAGGRVFEHRTERGVLREEIIKHGMHDITMSYPVVSLAVLRAFDNGKAAWPSR